MLGLGAIVLAIHRRLAPLPAAAALPEAEFLACAEDPRKRGNNLAARVRRSLLVAEGFHRIQPRSLPRRIHTEENADQAGHGNAEQHQVGDTDAGK